MRADSPLVRPERASTRAQPFGARDARPRRGALRRGRRAARARVRGLVAQSSPRGRTSPASTSAGSRSAQAVAKLDGQFAEVADEPVTFVAGEQSFSFAANQLGVEPDWAGAVAAAATSGRRVRPDPRLPAPAHALLRRGGPAPLAVSNAALEFALDRIATRSTARRGTRRSSAAGSASRSFPSEPGSGSRARRRRSSSCASLGSLERTARRGRAPVVVAAPRRDRRMLAPGRAPGAHRAVSRPVVLRGAKRSFEVPRPRIAALLALPRDGATPPRDRGTAGGRLLPRARRARRQAAASTPASPSRARASRSSRRATGTELDVPRDRAGAAPRRDVADEPRRVGSRSCGRCPSARPPRRWRWASTAGWRRTRPTTRARGTGSRTCGSGVTLLDGTLVAPGGTFSLNDDDRRADRGARLPLGAGDHRHRVRGGGRRRARRRSRRPSSTRPGRRASGSPSGTRTASTSAATSSAATRPCTGPRSTSSSRTTRRSWVLVKGFVGGGRDPRARSTAASDRRVESSAGTMRGHRLARRSSA